MSLKGRWFTPSRSRDWSIADGVSDLFVREIKQVRAKHPDLKKTDIVGQEVGSGQMHPLSTRVRGLDLFYQLRSFTWDDVTEEDGFLSPVFTFDVAIFEYSAEGFDQSFLQSLAIFWKQLFGVRIPSRVTPYRMYLHQKILMRFKEDFPLHPPYMKIDSPRYMMATWDQHGNHIFSNGTLCVMARSGDWDPDVSTAVMAFLVGLDWLVWHKNTFGW